MTDSGFAHVGGLTEMHELFLSDTSVSDNGLKVLRSFRRLKWLTLQDLKITDEGLAHIVGLNLDRLSVVKIPITRTGLQHIAANTQLTSLYLNGAAISDDDLGYLSPLKSLTDIKLYMMPIADRGMKHLIANHPTLTRLELYNLEVGDAGLKEIAQLRTLEGLSISGCRVTEAGVECLKSLKGLPEHPTMAVRSILTARRRAPWCGCCGRGTGLRRGFRPAARCIRWESSRRRPSRPACR